MKALIAFLVLFTILCTVYGLAFMGIIPVAKMAGKSPEANKILVELKLAKPLKQTAKTAAQTASAPAESAQNIADEKAALDAERAQVAIEKQALDRKAQAKAAPTAAAFVPTSDKMVDIYDTMKPDDLAALFAKMPDAVAADALTRMDEGKAGKVLVSIGPERSARLSMLMNRTTAAAQQTAQPG